MPHVHKNLSKEMDQCLHNCEECHDLCTQTVQYCLEKGNQHAAPELIRVLLDCAEICEPARVSCSAVRTCTRSAARPAPRSASVARNPASRSAATPG